GWTQLRAFEAGNWLSRDIPNASRIVEAWIARQQTKIAAATTSRYTVEKPFEKFASMICAGPQEPLIAAGMSGIAISVAQRKIPPITNAPMTEASTAFGASLRG